MKFFIYMKGHSTFDSFCIFYIGAQYNLMTVLYTGNKLEFCDEYSCCTVY